MFPGLSFCFTLSGYFALDLFHASNIKSDFILKDFIDTNAFKYRNSEIYIYKSFKFIYIIFVCAGLRCYVNFSLVLVSRVYSRVVEYPALGHAGIRSCSTWAQ